MERNMKKTKKMLKVEEDYHIDLERDLPEMITEEGMTHTADTLGISKATLGYWLLKFGFETKRVCLRPGEKLEIKREVD